MGSNKLKLLIVPSAIALLLLLPFWFYFIYLKPEQIARETHDRLLKIVDACKIGRDKIVYAWRFPLEGVLPFDDLTLFFKNLVIFPSGPLARSPLYENAIANYGLSNVLFELDHPKLLFLSTADQNQVLVKFVKQHYGISYSFSEVMPLMQCIDGAQKFWRFERSLSLPPAENETYWACQPDKAQFETAIFPEERNLFLLHQVSEIKMSWLEKFFRRLNLLMLSDHTICRHCRVEEKNTYLFTSKGVLPTFSFVGQLKVDPAKYDKFFIELAVEAGQKFNRSTLVELNLGAPQPHRFTFPLHTDAMIHRYEYDLRTLGFGKGELINQINVCPLYMLNTKKEEHFYIKRFGFASSFPVPQVVSTPSAKVDADTIAPTP